MTAAALTMTDNVINVVLDVEISLFILTCGLLSGTIFIVVED